MRISVTTESDIYPLEISDDLELENFKALCEMEVGPVPCQLCCLTKLLHQVGIPASEMILTFNARPMTDDKKPLKDYGIKDGDVVLVVRGNELLRRAAAHLQRQQQQQQQQRSQPLDVSQFDFGAIQLPGGGGGGASGNGNGNGNGNDNVSADSRMVTESAPPTTAGSGQVTEEQDQESREGSGEGGLGALEGTSEDDPGVIRDMLLANPEQLALLRHNNPRLAEALTGGDLEQFATVLREQQDARRDREQQRIRLLNADPFDMEAQKMIASEIQQENINANMEAAMEYNPESFGTVCMLYINCKVNGHNVKAFIDSGAQTTIMSQACAERCNIMRLVDHRWAGVAKGVGTQRIIGRVHLGQIQIEEDFLTSSFSILEEQSMDMLLGLDMLKRHQMCIDLKENKLKIGTSGKETRFLSESELPECARLTNRSEEDMVRQSEMMAREAEDKALAEVLARSAKEKAGGGSGDALQGTSFNPAAGFPFQRASASGGSSTASSDVVMAAPPPPKPNFSESDIQEIVNIGFTRQEAIDELRQQNGNKTQAIAALFARSFKM
ncbi:DNA damage inducible 1 homolog rngo isoform X2 [Oratosquilla oratoria]|uniref:DNA damage inducible 1 homolog rngo isoform X2 n=1 Tax=Oratosquilla oratoria TaxID=337810 RepID=UPI003F766400